MNPQKNIHRIDRLQDAFQVFNRLSQNLTDSYQDLEGQVASLTKELAAARDDRLKTLTEKEKLANRLQSLLEALPGGVIVVDDDSTIVEHNKAVVTLLGEQLVGQSWPEVMSCVFQSDCENPQERILKTGKVVSLSFSALGDEPGQIILLTDVTEIRMLQGMVEQQKRLSAMGKTVASIAHQIRTPLATAMLYASHLQNDNVSLDKKKKFSQRLVERLQHLERQVNDMLVFAKDGQFLTEQVSLDGLINTLREVVEGFLDNSCCALVIKKRTNVDQIVANDKALTGALTNLLGNAFEAICGQGDINLEIIEDGEKSLCFIVTDEGPGVSEEIREKIFEPFFTTRSNGTGLGLSVVDRVARAHGGSVWCESPQSGGSRFHLSLPIIHRTEILPSGHSHYCGSNGVN